MKLCVLGVSKCYVIILIPTMVIDDLMTLVK